MASAITLAFENWKAQEAASGKAVLLDEFVFANVPNLDPTLPIDRNEKLPPTNQIVHRQAVNKAGLASENAVAYSVTMGADIGNFDFNWIGLLNKASGTVAMITHAPTQKKLKNQNGQQGNVLTRSFILEFQGAAEETQIKTSAETWQIDFTARLSGIDEMQRLINVDSYGAAAFFNDGFEVTRSGEQYTVKKGLGYVGGLRGELAQNQILNGLRNTKVYADFSYQGNIVSQWNTVIKITAAATLNNYVDAAGFTHQVFPIASIDANGNVKDLRPMGALSSQETSALETRFKLDLSKKIDKANITHQMGNSTELVVSQQLLATELGKKQPAGNYAPAGDYATNAALTDGLNKKFDKAGGSISGNVTAEGDVASKYNSYIVKLETRGGKTGIVSSTDNQRYYTHTLQEKSGALMHLGDGGWMSDTGAVFGGISLLSDYRLNSIGYAYSASQTDTYQKTNHHFLNVFGYVNRNYGVQLAFTNNGRVGFRNIENNTPKKWEDFYTTANTSTDRNGYLRDISGSEDLQSVPIGGSILWNGEWDVNHPRAEFFWPNEGRSFSAATHPELAKIFPSLRLPDDRGYAIRIADNGKGIDAGRKVGSYQEDAMQNITGEIGWTANGLFTIANGAFTPTESTSNRIASAGDAGLTIAKAKFDASNQVRTANEFRMKNVAKILITRVK
ncbi:phage tail-collar fiber domain-containing protein [Providencia hangzhouensis]|uniref:phage tail-collar fiber domain-containing protein n=1 Tax=Providencia hangzhouensis TaxID=3031799 RepID=UPI0034DCFA2A